MNDLVERLRKADGHGSKTEMEAADEIERLQAEMVKLHADAATVVYALDCAGIVIDALISFLPPGQVMDPRLAMAKHNLDVAMTNLRRPPPVHSEALKIACSNLETLTEQRERLIACLNSGQILIDTLMTELRHNATLPLGPSLQLTAAHSQWTAGMKKLLGQDK